VKVPKKISPNPIIESTVEFRFKSTVPSSALFGILYGKISNEYKKYEQLPILELPRTVLETDSKFRRQPHYRFLKESFIIQLGPEMVSISVKNGYQGWDEFFHEINYLVNVFKELNIIERVTRIGMRYIDFFRDIDIYEKINMRIYLGDEPFKSASQYIRTELKLGEYDVLLQITNKAEAIGDGQKKFKGSLVDYDLSISKDLQNSNFYSEYNLILTKAHDLLKEHFFTILIRKDFLESLNPEY
jgi:uncharacterized protein (TIGR04255 family)